MVTGKRGRGSRIGRKRGFLAVKRHEGGRRSRSRSMMGSDVSWRGNSGISGAYCRSEILARTLDFT